MLTQQKLREILSYDPDTGEFIWIKSSRWGHTGKTAGSIRRRGYVAINISRRLYFAHRLAWLYVHGRWPETYIDHINGQRGDNCLANLRESSQSQNIANCRLSKANKSGYKGVSLEKRTGRYRANLGKNGKQVFLGYFDNARDAHKAYVEAAEKMHGNFARAA